MQQKGLSLVGCLVMTQLSNVRVQEKFHFTIEPD